MSDIIKGKDFFDYFNEISEQVDCIFAFDTAGRIHGYSFDLEFPMEVYIKKKSDILEKEGNFVQIVVNDFKEIPYEILEKFKFTTEQRTLVDLTRKYKDSGFSISPNYKAFEVYYGRHLSFKDIDIPEDLREEFQQNINEVLQ